MKKGIILFIAVFVTIQSFGQELKEFLESVDKISNIVKIRHGDAFEEAYSFDYTQPLDHNEKGDRVTETFTQKVMIYFVSKEVPTVINLEGYKIWGNYTEELTRMLGANQITIEHRFFGHSVSDKLDWSKLTVWQAATDQHEIIQCFRDFFEAGFVSTGISKGGQTTIFHRYLYPEDVQASVPIVAPHNLEREDARLYRFLDTVGGTECQQAIVDFQNMAFEKEDDILPMVKQKVKKNGWTFDKAGGVERAYRLCILEYSFSFWQWGYAECSEIPDRTASDFAIYQHLLDVSSIDFFSDQEYETFFPYFYQGLTEIGVYGYDITKFKKYFSEEEFVTFDFVIPDTLDISYEHSMMYDIDNWLKTDARNMLFIYGALDTWGATAVELGDNDQCLKMVLPQGHHGTRISSFPAEEQKMMLDRLKEWLEM